MSGSMGFLAAAVYRDAAGFDESELPDELQGQGLVAWRFLGNGKLLAIVPLLFDRFRLTFGNGPDAKRARPWGGVVQIGYDGGFDEYRDFDSLDDALRAMAAAPIADRLSPIAGAKQ